VFGTPLATPNAETRCVCREGYYNSNATGGLQCALCDVELGLNCPGKGYLVADIIVLPGYWRKADNATDVYACPRIADCPGSIALAALADSGDHDDANGMCVFPRKGPLCVQCVEDYFEDVNDGVCKTCKDSWLAIALVLTGMLVGVVGLVIYVKRVISKAKEENSDRGILIKVLFSGLQMNAISLAFAFQFEGFFDDYLTTQSAVSSAGTSALNLDCLWGSGSVYPFYVETLVYMVFPLILLGLPVFILAAWFACNIAKPNAREIRSRVMNLYFAGAVVVLFLAHPTLSTRAMKLFQCTKIADTWYLKEQLEEECWSTNHMLWVVVCGIPMLLLYVVGIPASAFLILYRNRAAIPTAATTAHDAFHSKFSFLYKV
jgi:hypothetical protein